MELTIKNKQKVEAETAKRAQAESIQKLIKSEGPFEITYK